MTGAENGAREQAAYAVKDELTRHGFTLKKEWIATLDAHTRDSHAAADGQQVEIDEPFDVGGAKLMYPCDPSGPAREVYNCRCSRRDIVGGFDEVEPALRRDQLNGQLISDMSYEEWAAGKRTAFQTVGTSSVPKAYDGNFDDFLPLSLSETEESSLRELNRLAIDKNAEYAQIIVNGKAGAAFTSGEYGAVQIPMGEIADGTIILHSHTNDTPLSAQDFRFLLDPRVDKIGVVAYNYDVYMVSVGNGWRPSAEEFCGAVDKIAKEVDREIIGMDDFWTWTEQERNYMATREQAYQIARRFEWNMEGGRI